MGYLLRTTHSGESSILLPGENHAGWDVCFGFDDGFVCDIQRKGADCDDGCTKLKDSYSCNWNEFRPALELARVVGVPVVDMDRFTAVQLRQLAGALGKNVATRDQPADLVFSVVPVDTNGIDFGPRDRPLATLQVYAPDATSGHRTLLWVETYTGQPDRPWAADVKAVIDQFRERVNRR